MRKGSRKRTDEAQHFKEIFIIEGLLVLAKKNRAAGGRPRDGKPSALAITESGTRIRVRTGAPRHAAAKPGMSGLSRATHRDVPRIISLSRASYRKVQQNLWWAAGYNIVAILLAAGVLAPDRYTPQPCDQAPSSCHSVLSSLL